MKKSICAVGIILISGFIVSCTSVPGEIPTSQGPVLSSHFISVSIPDANDISQAVDSLQQYSDTATIAWMELNNAHQLKIEHLTKLVSSYGKNLGNSSQTQELLKLLKEVDAKPLSLSSQYNNASLDHYTAVTDSLTYKTLSFYTKLTSTRKAKPLMVLLAKKIQDDDHEINFRREQYNQAAKRYNDFFWEKRTFLLQAKGELPERPIRACFRNKV